MENVVDLISCLVSLISMIVLFYFSWVTRKMEKATAENQVFQIFHEIDVEIEDFCLKIKTEGKEIPNLDEHISARRGILLDGMAYACGLYLDGKVDKKRFEKEYAIYIMKKTRSKIYSDLLREDSLQYKNILDVVEIWIKKPPKPLQHYLTQQALEVEE